MEATILTSDNLKTVGFKFTLEDGTKIEVLDYLTASAQVAKKLAVKTSGTQVLYILSIDGKKTELKGDKFSRWCNKNNIKIIHKGGADEAKEKIPFLVSFYGLKKKAETATIEDLKEAATFLQDLAKQKETEAKNKEAEEIKQLEARLKQLKAKQKK